jgi:transposase
VIAVTRKNFLFLGSEAGGERAAIIYTVLETAKLNGLDPEAYLADVITKIVNGHANRQIDDLLPWVYAATPRLKAVA